MKRLGRIVWQCFMLSIVAQITYVCNAQNIVCSDNVPKQSNIRMAVDLKEVYYYSYDLQQKDSANFLLKVIVDTTIESAIAQRHATVFQQKSSIKLDRSIAFNRSYKAFAVVKYFVITKEGIRSKFVVEFTKNNGSWVSTESVDKDLIYIMDVLKPIGFWNFYSLDDNAKYPEINRLKKQTKGAEGIMDVEKIANVIRQNSATLSKYLD